MHPSTPQTTTLEIIQAYFKQINPPPPGAQIKKQIKHASLKIQFQVGLFHAKLLNSPNNIYPPPSASPFQHPQHRIWAQIQKFTCTLLFASSNPFQNGMTQPGGIKNHKVITFQA